MEQSWSVTPTHEEHAGEWEGEWKDWEERWSWESARGKKKTGRAAPKVVGWLRSRCTKWVAARSKRASDGRRKKERESEKQRWCSSWAEQNAFGAAEYRSHISSDYSLHWTSFLQYARHMKSCIIWATIYWRLYLPLSSSWIHETKHRLFAAIRRHFLSLLQWMFPKSYIGNHIECI